MKVSWHAFKLKLVEAVAQSKRFCGKPKRKKTKNQRTHNETERKKKMGFSST